MRKWNVHVLLKFSGLFVYYLWHTCMDMQFRQYLLLKRKFYTKIGEVLKYDRISDWMPPTAFWAAALKGSMTYAFTHRGIFSSSFFFSSFSSSFSIPPPWLWSSNRSLKPKSQSRAWIPGSGLKFQPYSLNPSFIAHIPIFWLKSQPYDSNYSLA